MKVHENYIGRKVVAVSDPDIIGKKIEDIDKGLEINISKEFYGEKEFEFSDVLQFIMNSENVNAIGNEIVEALVAERIIEPKNIITIGGVKHAQIYGIS
jgi:hypothetical protein